LFASESEWAKMSRKVRSNAILEDVQHKQLYKDYKDAKAIDKVQIKYHVIRSWWLSSRVANLPQKRHFRLVRVVRVLALLL
jgi:hypothetical protein